MGSGKWKVTGNDGVHMVQRGKEADDNGTTSIKKEGACKGDARYKYRMSNMEAGMR
jgi:hypothetical protein